MEKNKILVLDGFARQTLPIVRGFKEEDCEVAVICVSKLDVGYASYVPDKKILVDCKRADYDSLYPVFLEIIKKDKYTLAVPTTDGSSTFLANHYDEFSKYIGLATNRPEVHGVAIDKLRTMEVCMAAQIPCPYSFYNIEKISDVINSKVMYPLVVKPRVGFGAVGFKKVDSEEELRALFSDDEDVSGYVFQEYIPQTDIQYECAMYMDKNGNAKTALVFSKNRWFPVNGGSSTLNVTVDRPDIIENCTKLLKEIGWVGAADIDLIQDPRDGTAKIMEINPRVSGSVKICYMSGVNQSKQMLETALGREVTEYKDYKLDMRLRCSQTDLLWFIKSKDRFKSKPSFFSNKNTKDQIFYLSDPLPYFTFSIAGLFKYKDEMDKRS